MVRIGAPLLRTGEILGTGCASWRQVTPGTSILGPLGTWALPHTRFWPGMTRTSWQRFKEDLSSAWCQQQMKPRITLSLPSWRKDAQTMPEPTAKLRAGPGEAKRRDGFGKALEKCGQKGPSGAFKCRLLTAASGSDSPELQMARAGNGLWPVLSLCQPSRRLASMDF